MSYTVLLISDKDTILSPLALLKPQLRLIRKYSDTIKKDDLKDYIPEALQLLSVSYFQNYLLRQRMD